MKTGFLMFISKTILPNLALIACVFAVGGVSGVAALKVSQVIPVPDKLVDQVSELKDKVDTAIQGVDDTSAVSASGSKSRGKALGCIVTIDGNKYDVTNLKKTHSGGDIFVCNTDMSNSYHNQHGTNLARMERYLVNETQNAGTSGSSTGNIKARAAVNSSAVFTAVSLASHNTSSSCYIAYSGKVYDVSSHPSWGGCSHHGVSGGQDITSIFPHPISYLSSVPNVGTFGGSAANNGNGNTTIVRKDDDDDEREEEEIEYEYEDEKEEEKEKEDESEHSSMWNLIISTLQRYI